MATVGARLRELRLSARMSQATLGKRLGVSGPTISNYETGYSRLVADELPEFAKVLGCSPCDFFADVPQEQAPTPTRATDLEFAAGFAEDLLGLARISPARMAIIQSVLRGLDEAGVE